MRGTDGENLIPNNNVPTDNWQLALGRFDHFHIGDFSVKNGVIEINIISTLKDVYDFKDDHFIGSLHNYGLAKNFPVEGTIQKTVYVPLNF